MRDEWPSLAEAKTLSAKLVARSKPPGRRMVEEIFLCPNGEKPPVRLRDAIYVRAVYVSINN
jgi:hypothetical protein